MPKTLKQVRQKMELSRLESQKNLLAKDVDLTGLSFITRNLRPLRFEDVVTGGDITRTIEGASTVTINIDDTEGIIRSSGRLANKVDIKLDGLWFRLVKITKQGWNITLTFESREVAVLRTYNGKRVVGWGKMRRSRFMQILVEEVKEFKIPFVCPDLVKPKKVVPAKERADERQPGMGFQTDPRYSTSAYALRVKGKLATKLQLRNMEIVLDTGRNMGANRKVLVSSIMTVIQESSALNLPYGHSTSVGMFQEIDIWGDVKTRMDIAGAATRYFRKAIKFDKDHPQAEYWEISQAAQRSAFPLAYAQWRNEAERVVTAYGITDDYDLANNMQLAEAALDTDKYQFWRGHPTSEPGKKWPKENTWDCLQRLANQVNWRCFEVSGTIYFTTDKHLFKSAPRARISERTDGVDWIDFDYDIGKPTSQVTVSAYVDKWEAPPGTVIEIFNMGPVNGRWLVTEIRRGLFDQLATITLKKPEARLPEPKQEDPSSLVEAFSQVASNQYVPTPGYDPDPPSQLPKGSALRQAVLNNAMIEFTSESQRKDIITGMIDERVLQFLIQFTEAGYKAVITALKSDHDPGSNHNKGPGIRGRAVDIGNYSINNLVAARAAMLWVNGNQFAWGPDLEFIGPIPELVIPQGWYDTKTLNEHKNHLHVGWDK